MKKFFSLFVVLMLLSLILAVPALAAPEAAEAEAVLEETADNAVAAKAIAAASVVAFASAAGAIAMGLATSKSAEAIARQPEAEGKIRTGTMLGLVFIETAIIYALIVAILIIFIL